MARGEGARRSSAAALRKPLSDQEKADFEAYLSLILARLGLDQDAPGAQDTHRRYLAALISATAGYDGDPKLTTSFPLEQVAEGEKSFSQVVEGPIAFSAICEHHALPFFGNVHIGYLPAGRVIGISKMTRVVRLFSRRFTLQERLTEEIADSIIRATGSNSVGVLVSANHLCTRIQGVHETHTGTNTTVWKGYYASDPDMRSEFLSLCGIGHTLPQG